MVKNIEFKNGQSVALSPPHEDSVTCLSKFKGIIVSGSKDRSIRYWNSGTNQLMHVSKDAHQNGITCMASDNDYVYSGCRDNIVKSWEFKELSKDQFEQLLDDKENDKEIEALSRDELELEYGRYRADTTSFMIGHNAQINTI